MFPSMTQFSLSLSHTSQYFFEQSTILFIIQPNPMKKGENKGSSRYTQEVYPSGKPLNVYFSGGGGILALQNLQGTASALRLGFTT
jgi:hypothetical protein